MDAKKPKTKKYLCMPGLLSRTRHSFDKINENISRKVNILLFDCLMIGLAMFSLKYPSRMQFDRDHNEVDPRYVQKILDHWLRNYRVENLWSNIDILMITVWYRSMQPAISARMKLTAKRLLQNLRNSHPHLKMIIVLDQLYADGVIMKLLRVLVFVLLSRRSTMI